MTKQEAQRKLDALRKNPKAFEEGTKEFEDRQHLEMVLDQHLYERSKDGS